MSERIIVALIGVLGTFAGSYFTNRKTIALIEYRLKELEKKVDKHNNLVERMYQVEKELGIVEAKIED